MHPVVPLIAPLLAPLSLSLVRYWTEESGRILRNAEDAEALRDLLAQTSEPTATAISLEAAHFIQELVRLPRWETFKAIDPLVPAEPVPRPKITTNWLQTKLAELIPGMEAVDRDTINRWAHRGIVRQLGHGLIEPQSAAELTTAGQMVLPDLKKGWLDHKRNPDEPYWHCWCQIRPGTPVFPCGYPTPPSIPPYALLWTNWQGAVWNPLFVTMENLGSIAFAGAELRRGRRRWLVTKEQLRMWDPDMLPLDPGILERADEAFQSAATWTLARLAVSRLSIVTEELTQPPLLLR